MDDPEQFLTQNRNAIIQIDMALQCLRALSYQLRDVGLSELGGIIGEHVDDAEKALEAADAAFSGVFMALCGNPMKKGDMLFAAAIAGLTEAAEKNEEISE